MRNPLSPMGRWVAKLACGALTSLCLLSTAQAGEPPVRKVLPNGIPVIVQDSISSSTVSLNIFIRVGSMHESKELNGISHFYEHMFFRGTPRRTGLQFKRDIESLGGVTNASTTRDYTHFYINLPKQYLRQGLEILADAYLNAECSLDSVKAEREVVLEEYRLGRNQPGRLTHDKLMSLIFSKHPYGRTIIGPEDNLNRIGRAELLNHKKSYYVPSRTSLVIVGDLDRAAVVKDCEELFGNYRSTGAPDPEFVYDQPPVETQVISETTRGSQSQIYLGFLGPAVKTKPDIYSMDVLSFLIGYGKSSLLSKALDSDNSNIDAHLDFLTQTHPGMITLSMTTPPGQEDAALAKVDSLLKDVQEGKFTEADLKRAKTLVTTLYDFGNETNSGKAGSLGLYETMDTSAFATTYDREVEKVTAKDIMATAKKYLGQPHYRYILKAPKKA